MNPETSLYADLVYVNQAIEIYTNLKGNYDYCYTDTSETIVSVLKKRRDVLEKRLLSQFVEGYEE